MEEKLEMKLYDHQQRIINDDPKSSGLWLGTGTGKTRIALLLAEGDTLVIAPKTQVEDRNWQRELEGLDHKISKLAVVSKETFRRDWNKLPRFKTVIVDEAHTCLGVTAGIRWKRINGKAMPFPRASQLFDALNLYLRLHKPERLYLCTATIVRSPMTVWAAAKLLGRDWEWYKWRSTFYFMLPMPGREVWTPKTDRTTKDRLAKAVQGLGYTGRLEDFFDVPDQSYKTIFVGLTKGQKDRIKKLSLEYPDPLVLLGKTHQVENGVLSGDEFNVPQFFKNEKMDKIADLMAEFPRLVIFAKYRAQIDQIAGLAKQMKKQTFVLTGDTKDRGELLAKANAADDYVFIAQAQVSAGWELPDCPVVVFASMSYSVVDRIQSEGRIHRANKLKKNLYITLVVEGGIDEAVHDAIEQKKDFNERIYLKL